MDQTELLGYRIAALCLRIKADAAN
jgi:hypothetical protein